MVQIEPGGGLELTTLGVVVGVWGEGAVHAESGNGNDVVIVVVGLPARAEAGSEVGSFTEELSTLWRRRLGSLGGRGAED